MEQVTKQCVGIDIAKSNFTACLCKHSSQSGLCFSQVATFDNSTRGFNQLLKWARKQTSANPPVTSYAGFDVVERESGSSVRGKTRISKKGNGRIRAALYFPALVASRYNAPLQAVYQRVNAGKASKMVGVVSLQRKLLLLIYSMWKSGTMFEDRPLASGDQERKPLLRHKDEVFENKVGRPVDLPTRDELPTDLSRKALLRQ